MTSSARRSRRRRRRGQRRGGMGEGSSQPRGPRPRRRGREPHRGVRARRRRQGLDRSRTGYAYGTDVSDAGLAELAEAAVGAAPGRRRGRELGRTGASRDRPRSRASRNEGVASTETADVIELAKRIERAALDRDERVTAVEEVVYVDEDSTRRHRLLARRLRRLRGLGRLLVPAGDGDGELRGPDRARVRRGRDRRPISTPARSAPRPGTRRARCSGPASRSRGPVRWCSPTALPPASPASSAERFRADEVQRGRSPFADRLGEEIASAALRIADDGTIPAASPAPPSTARESPRGRTPLLGDGKLLAYLHDSYTARRGGATSTGNASRASYRSPPSVSPSNLMIEPGELSFEELLGRAGDGVYVTEVAGFTRASTPSPAATRSARAGGRSAAESWPSRCASSRSRAICSARWPPSGRSARGRAGCLSAVRSRARRCSSASSP